jgi:hypothetical protein
MSARQFDELPVTRPAVETGSSGNMETWKHAVHAVFGKSRQLPVYCWAQPKMQDFEQNFA